MHSRRSSFIRGIGLASALSFSLSTCATSGPNKGDFNVISHAQEKQIGQQVDMQVRQDMEVLDSEAATGYLKTLGNEIARASKDVKAEDFQFHVVKDPSINAFAVPGGHVYMNLGLIEAADSKAELAGVLAHEMGHVVARHGTEQLTKAYGLNLVAALALGENPGLLQQLAAQVGGTALLLKYSRGAEREADKLAVKYLYGAGIHPIGLVHFFQRLQKETEGGAPPKALAWLQTHPLTEDRIKDTRKRIAKLPEKPLEQDSQAFHAYKRNLLNRVAELPTERVTLASPNLPLD